MRLDRNLTRHSRGTQTVRILLLFLLSFPFRSFYNKVFLELEVFVPNHTEQLSHVDRYRSSHLLLRRGWGGWGRCFRGWVPLLIAKCCKTHVSVDATLCGTPSGYGVMFSVFSGPLRSLC